MMPPAQCAPADAPFIRLAGQTLPGALALPYMLARFHLARFEPQIFAQYAIDFPIHIRNSVGKRQAEFAAGRICAQAILASHGVSGHGIAIGASREPLWPAHFLGSITHNGHYAAAVACPRHDLLGVGIDIETIVDDSARAAMVQLVVSPEEAGYLDRSATGLSFDCLLTLVFSAKESFFKAAFDHVQRFIDFDAVQLEHIDAERRVMRFRCVQAISARLPEGLAYQAGFAFIDEASVLTVVTLGKNMPTDNFDSYLAGADGV